MLDITLLGACAVPSMTPEIAMPSSTAPNLESTYLRLRNDATVETLAVDQSFWEQISSGKLGSFHHEYLVTAYRFDGD